MTNMSTKLVTAGFIVDNVVWMCKLAGVNGNFVSGDLSMGYPAEWRVEDSTCI